MASPDDRATPDPVLGSAASGIVLAGGRSRRFGGDKLRASVAGRPVLHHAILALAAACREVIVAGAHGGEDAALDLPDGLPVPIRIVLDQAPFEGPLAGLAAGLGAASEPLALVAGGDMPGLAVPVLLAMLREADEAGASARAVVLAQRDGWRPLPLAVPTLAAGLANDLLAAGRRSLYDLVRALGPLEIGEDAWRSLDPSGGTIVDIDRVEDIAGFEPLR